MMMRTKTQNSPTSTPSNSVWAATARAGDPPLKPLPGSTKVDVAVIGAGFTGLSAAHYLHASGLQTAVLDANDVGFGASGRTGGMGVPRYKTGFATLDAKYGTDAVRGLHRLIIEAVDTLEELVRDHRIECNFQRHGHITAAHCSEALAGLRNDVDWLARVQGDRTPSLFDARTMQLRTGTSVYAGGYFDPRGAGVHPLEYVRGLARSLAERGVAIHPRTPVSRIDEAAGGGFEVLTPHGTVTARQVLIATNAYTDAHSLNVNLGRRIVPVASSVIATAPLAEELAATILPQGNLVTDTRKLTNYFRTLPDRRLMFGGRGDLLGRDAPGSFRGLEELLLATYPQLGGKVEIVNRWSGKVAVTLDDFPHIGSLKPGLHFALGYGGRGVALAQLLGKMLAKLARGERVMAGPMSDNAFPPIPFHIFRVPAMQTMVMYYRWLDQRAAKQPRPQDDLPDVAAANRTSK